MYCATVQSPAMPRSADCQVCRCPLTSPGITIMPAASIISAPSGASSRGAIAPMRPIDHHVALRQLAQLRIHGDDVSALDQHAGHAAILSVSFVHAGLTRAASQE